MKNALTRLKEYIDVKGVSISAFEKSIGMSNASFGKSLKNGGEGIGSDKLEKILKKYHDLNPVWLLTGTGEMLLDENATVDNMAVQTNKEIIALQKQMLAGRDAEIEWHKHRIEKLQQQVISLGGKPVESD